MAEPLTIACELRARLISAPEVILEDRDLMRALVSGNERAMGDNVVDMRGLAMQRLEARLERLEETHGSALAAAYDNLSGTQSVHRAVLHLLDAPSFEDFLAALGTDAADCLRVDCVRLILESRQLEAEPELMRLGELFFVAEPGFGAAYLGRAPADKPVSLREIQPGQGGLYGGRAEAMRSEALIHIDLGPGRLPGMLALGAADPGQFRPGQATDLLAFFGGVVERAMRRWLE